MLFILFFKIESTRIIVVIDMQPLLGGALGGRGVNAVMKLRQGVRFPLGTHKTDGA